jgi:uncharacterized protein YjeT (DUF2065 family)
MTQPADDISPMPEATPDKGPLMPKATVIVLAICVNVCVFGLGLAVGGHEWRKVGFQAGVVLILSTIVVAVVTGLMHSAYCRGWQRGLKTLTIEPDDTPSSTTRNDDVVRLVTITEPKEDDRGSGSEPLFLGIHITALG